MNGCYKKVVFLVLICAPIFSPTAKALVCATGELEQLTIAGMLPDAWCASQNYTGWISSPIVKWGGYSHYEIVNTTQVQCYGHKDYQLPWTGEGTQLYGTYNGVIACNDMGCDIAPDLNGSGTTGGIPATTCQNNCVYEAGGGIDAGTWWTSDYSANGEACESIDDPLGDAPEGCSLVDGVAVCDCTATPEAWYCGDVEPPTPPPVTPPGTPTDPSVPPQNPTDPNNPGGPSDPGDGNPDTPGGPGSGTGDGDTDEDGERDIDCNPLSNPDCNFQGSGTGSNDCDTQPSCQGDPVQCAILYQVWASGCFGEDETVTGEHDCNAPFNCEGGDLACAQIKISRDQYCKLYESEGFDHSVEDDQNFGDDLKTQADETNIMDVIDDGGFAGAGSCPADMSVETGWGAVNVSFSSFCSLASTIRPLIILAALLMGYMIIGGKR